MNFTQVLFQWPTLRTLGLLLLSNLFMITAWYGHLRFKGWSLVTAIFVSWLLALPEYAIQVPANRWGHATLSAYELKILQEFITFLVFIFFAYFFLGETPKWNHLVGMGLIVAGVCVSLMR